ncbi:MAG: alanine racemase [Deltaproteobacteria bacterium]|nr:alanine racemase [Deltaproteobacteria bacterium]
MSEGSRAGAVYLASTIPVYDPEQRAIDGIRPTFAEIDLSAIADNYRAVRAHTQTEVWPVIKADAYGHGAEAVAKVLCASGAKGLCVALVEEALSLRAAGISADLLVMSGIYREGLDEALDAGITPVVHDPSHLALLATRSARGQRSEIHLKVDTGMSRLGITLGQLAAISQRLAQMPGVSVRGLMTHLANADCDDPSFTDVQLDRFDQAREIVVRDGHAPSVFHAANSAGAFRSHRARMDLVRPGIVLYGVAPFANDGPPLRPAMSIKSAVLALREVPSGTAVGYGGAFVTTQPSVLATIPIGYADGFFRRLSSEAEVLIRGARAKVVGNVSMDLCTVDVTHLAQGRGIVVGDEVVLLGAQSGDLGAGLIRAEEIAQRVETIPYEVLCALSRRVRRLYRPGLTKAPAR